MSEPEIFEQSFEGTDQRTLDRTGTQCGDHQHLEGAKMEPQSAVVDLLGPGQKVWQIAEPFQEIDRRGVCVDACDAFQRCGEDASIPDRWAGPLFSARPIARQIRAGQLEAPSISAYAKFDISA